MMMMGSSARESLVVGGARANDDAVYVFLGTNLKKGKALLDWVIKEFTGQVIVVAHVHQPPTLVPMGIGGSFPIHKASKVEARLHIKAKRIEKKRLLNLFVQHCFEKQVQAREIMIEMNDVYQGIVSLVIQCQIKRLVIGKKSIKGQQILEEGLRCSQIWLVHNQKLVYSRRALVEHPGMQLENDENQAVPVLLTMLDSEESLAFSTPPSELEDEYPGDQVYLQLKEAQTCCSEAFEKFRRDREVEKDSVKAFVHKAKEMEKALQRNKHEMEEMKKQLEKFVETARLAEEQRSALEQRMADLQQEHDDAVREAEELRMPVNFSEFTLAELHEATNGFRALIGRGGYGPVYKGILRHNLVAIKMLDDASNQGRSEYKQEVTVANRVRHPNMVTLLGACSEGASLVYEYLPNGSLEDWFDPRIKTPPLSWQTRTRIIAELRSVLIFIHHNKPYCIIHADLKPANILLDANFVSKLGDFGTARLIRCGRTEEISIIRRTIPMGTVGYMDPTFFTTGELTPKSDIYSFGIIILRLLTGKKVIRIAEIVEEELRSTSVAQIFDASAGVWPLAQAEELMRLALRCCHMDRMRRPDLTTQEWEPLDTLRAIAGNHVGP